MPIRSDFQPGEFCWVDLAAHDFDAARTFYSELFGWNAVQQETSGGPPYAFFLKDNAPTAALGQMSDEMKGQGIPSMWNSYVSVADCAEVEAKAKSLGATITVPTMDVPGHGKLCYFLDPGGASLALWQDTSADGPALHREDPGSLSWNELMCKDIQGSKDFYSSLFGWQFADMDMGEVTYSMIKVGDRDAGGMMPMEGPQWEGVPPHWMVYFAVADCAAAAERVTALGGKVCVPPTPIGVGVFSVVNDAQGATFSIIEVHKQDC